MSGRMCDQMSANGNISELQYEPDVAQQFPLACRVRQRVFQNRMVYSKTASVQLHTLITFLAFDDTDTFD